MPFWIQVINSHWHYILRWPSTRYKDNLSRSLTLNAQVLHAFPYGQLYVDYFRERSQNNISILLAPNMRNTKCCLPRSPVKLRDYIGLHISIFLCVNDLFLHWLFCEKRKIKHSFFFLIVLLYLKLFSPGAIPDVPDKVH